MDKSLEDASDNVQQDPERNPDDQTDGMMTVSTNSLDTIDTPVPEKMTCESEDVPKDATSCKRLQTILDSESESDDMPSSNNNKSNNNNSNSMEKSDTESEGRESGLFNNNKKRKLSKVRIDSDSDSDVDDGNNQVTLKSNNISNLVDSESEEEEPIRREADVQTNSDENEGDSDKGKTEKKLTKKKQVSKRAAKDEAMNKIHSETQRLIRESSVYLPYHRPKQRSLGEFLGRRKVAPSLPKASSITNKLKISATIVDQVLEKKEEEAEIFYKSSDSEEEESNVEEKNHASAIEPAPELDIQEETCIEETQKLQKGDIHKRQQVIHNGSLEFGVPRKLFLDEDRPSIVEEQTPGDEKDGLDDHKHQQKEYKRDLKDVSMPRKLFNENSQQYDTSQDQDSDKTSSVVASDDLVRKVSEIETTAEDCEISDTPMISNKEIMKINGKNFTSNESHIEREETVETNEKQFQQPNNLSQTSAKKSLLSNLSKLPKPKLHGSIGMMIDLTDTVKPDKTAINNLVDRFLTKHAPVNKQDTKNTEVTVLNTEITPDGLKITKDIIPYKVKVETVEDSDMNKPGAKFTKFKEEMEKTMASKRKEEWEQKEKEDENSDQEADEYEIEDTPTDAEIEGEDNDDQSDELKDKKRKSCAFHDDEAQLSENDNIQLSEEEEEEEKEEEEEDDEEEEHGVEDEYDHGENQDEDEEEEKEMSDDDDDDNDDTEQQESKKFSRILKIDDESNSGDENNQPSQESLKCIMTNEEEQSSQTKMKNSLEEINQIDFTSQLSSVSSSIDILQSQIIEESGSLSGLASTDFPDSQNYNKPNLKGLVSSDQASSEMIVTDSQLINLCSGSFSTHPPISEPDCSAKSKYSEDNANIDRGELIDHQFSLKICSSSDDENDDGNVVESRNKKFSKAKKKKVQKLLLSDDEGEEEERQNYSDEEEEEEEVQSDEEKFIDYDSEENEVVVVPKKDIKKVAANFLEEEAELSESDWDSADEDEKDMDTYEVEDGDNEVIDESLVRDQIGKIHARQLLDEDNRDVRMLKEMLFEDGDLHDDKGGRERKFKWKNIDSIGLDNSSEQTNEEGGVEGLDEEHHDAASEVEWRKLRLERQRFLDERAKPENGEEIDGADDQLFKLGMKALGRKNNSKNFHNSNSADILSINKKKSIVPRSVSDLVQCSSKSIRVMRKGSFLTRGDQVLAKLAIMTKQTDMIALAPANAGNFVFTHLSPSVAGSTGVVGDTDGEDEDQHSATKNANTPTNNKFNRKRKLIAGATPKTTKKAKVEVEQSSGKKLF